MMNTFNELERFVTDMTEEVRNIKATIEYLERFLMDESPMVPADIEQLKSELTEATEALEISKAYSERLMAYAVA